MAKKPRKPYTRRQKAEPAQAAVVPPTDILPDDFESDEAAAIDAGVADMETAPSPAPPPIRMLAIEVSLSRDLGDGYVPRHADCRLTRRQGEILQRLWRGLYQRHARLENGLHVDNAVGAIRWLLERIAFAEQSG